MTITVLIRRKRVLVTGWRCRHKNEPGGYDKTPNGMPEVRPSFNAPPITFTSRLQYLTYDVMSTLNRTITPMQWHNIYSGDRWATNEQGWDDSSNPDKKFADHVNGLDLGEDDPSLMKAILMGGSLYQGLSLDDQLWMYPGIHAVDENDPCTAEDVIRNGWYFACVSWERDRIVSPFAQGNGGHVYAPLILREPTPYPLSWFEKWERDETPDPLKYYE